MRALSHEDAFQVLLLQAADGGRGELLFGESLERAKVLAAPFLVSRDFPDVYLEHPLCGQPFLDVTVLYGDLDEGVHIPSALAGEHARMLGWFSKARCEFGDVSCGFELDTKEEDVPEAAVHFQPRGHRELVEPFCRLVGEPSRASLYLGLAERMPAGWPLSFFGMFRGRPDFPLRVCGYMGDVEKEACAHDPGRLGEAFDTVGFSAYDGKMLAQLSTLLSAAPGTVDFQFDVYPDGRIGETFAVDVRFGVEQPASVRETFSGGAGARVMGLLESWGAADARWKDAVEAVFACGLPVEGGASDLAFTLMPQWVKARWTATRIAPAKLYHLAKASVLERD